MLDIGWDNGENSFLRHIAVRTIIYRNIRSNPASVCLLGYWCFFYCPIPYIPYKSGHFQSAIRAPRSISPFEPISFPRLSFLP